jgi:2-keto-4-pentenoate hydratase/2-oxohepta-3-ene-1,7-dioic acid hydratase in catechol pathway
MLEQRQRKNLKLLEVCVLALLARLVIDSKNRVALQYDDVSNATPPYFLIEEPAWLKVNGQVKQSSNLNKMIWSVAEQISKLSEAFELFPGDIIYSGTPENVGPVVRGDVIEMHIDRLPNLSVKIV